MSPLAEHMKRVYQVYYFPNDYREYLVTQAQPYMDVRHIIRTKLVEIHDAGPSAVARAEKNIGHPKPPGYRTIIHSRKVVKQTISYCQPLLLKRVDRLVRVTGAGLLDSC